MTAHSILYRVLAHEAEQAEAQCLDRLFRDCVEALDQCIRSVHADLPFAESVARDQLVDLCTLYLSEKFNPPNG